LTRYDRWLPSSERIYQAPRDSRTGWSPASRRRISANGSRAT